MKEPYWHLRNGISDIREAEQNREQLRSEAERVYEQIRRDSQRRPLSNEVPLRIRVRPAR